MAVDNFASGVQDCACATASSHIGFPVGQDLHQATAPSESIKIASIGGKDARQTCLMHITMGNFVSKHLLLPFSDSRHLETKHRVGKNNAHTHIVSSIITG